MSNESPVAAGILYIYIHIYYNSLYITSLCIYICILYIYGCMKWFNEHGPPESTDVTCTSAAADFRFIEGGGVFANLHMADAWRHVIPGASGNLTI